MKVFRALILLLGLAALPACATAEAPANLLPSQPAPSLRTSAPMAPTPAPAPVPAAPRTFVVHFDFDSADIRASAMQILYEASQAAGTVKPAAIRIHGYADGSGNRAYNQKLSERRAKAVADQFAKLGIKLAVVETKGFGKSTTKGRSKDNRRVEILFEGGAETASPSASAAPHSELAAQPQALTILTLPASPTTISLPVALQTAGKQAIKRDRVRMGTAWIPPALAVTGPSRMGGRAV